MDGLDILGTVGVFNTRDFYFNYYSFYAYYFGIYFIRNGFTKLNIFYLKSS
jgi:hypothetical protein